MMSTIKELHSRIIELDPYHDELYHSRDDLSISRLFASVVKKQLRYSVTAREFFFYDDTRWAQDVGGMHAEKLAKVFVKALMLYSMKVDDPEYTSFVSRYGNRAGRKRMLEDCRDFIFVQQEDFDRQPYLFNCKNCTFDLQQMKALPHDPDLLLSKVSNVVYDPEAVSEHFSRFMSEIMNSDEPKIEYIQKSLGSSLPGVNLLEQFYIFYGPLTRNGKGTLISTIIHLFGDYGMTIQPETLAMKDRNSRNASGDIARLDGCRFLSMSEPPKRMKLDSALIKSLVGRDAITARALYEREHEFTPVFSLFVNCNHLPLATDDTLFSSDRVKVITFDRHFEEEEQDKHLKEKLITEANISGIFNWLLEGYRKFVDDGEILTEPEAVKQATEDYRLKSDKMQCFIDDVFIYTEGFNSTVREAYQAFESWCHLNGYGVENRANFTDELKSKGLFSTSATIDGRTVRNVIKNHSIDAEYLGEPPPEY